MPTPEPIDVKEKKSYRQMNKEEKSIVSDTLITFLKDPNIRLMDKWFIMKRFLRGIKEVNNSTYKSRLQKVQMIASKLYVCRKETITWNERTHPRNAVK